MAQPVSYKEKRSKEFDHHGYLQPEHVPGPPAVTGPVGLVDMGRLAIAAAAGATQAPRRQSEPERAVVGDAVAPPVCDHWRIGEVLQGSKSRFGITRLGSLVHCVAVPAHSAQEHGQGRA